MGSRYGVAAVDARRQTIGMSMSTGPREQIDVGCLVLVLEVWSLQALGAPELGTAHRPDGKGGVKRGGRAGATRHPAVHVAPAGHLLVQVLPEPWSPL